MLLTMAHYTSIINSSFHLWHLNRFILNFQIQQQKGYHNSFIFIFVICFSVLKMCNINLMHRTNNLFANVAYMNQGCIKRRWTRKNHEISSYVTNNRADKAFHWKKSVTAVTGILSIRAILWAMMLLLPLWIRLLSITTENLRKFLLFPGHINIQNVMA